jgi:hypothetical protein
MQSMQQDKVTLAMPRDSYPDPFGRSASCSGAAGGAAAVAVALSAALVVRSPRARARRARLAKSTPLQALPQFVGWSCKNCAAPSAPLGPLGLSHRPPAKYELPCGRPPASCVAVPAPHPGLDIVEARRVCRRARRARWSRSPPPCARPSAGGASRGYLRHNSVAVASANFLQNLFQYE